MLPDDEWEAIRGAGSSGFAQSAGIGALRLTLLFGSAAVAFALLATPIAARFTEPREAMWSRAPGIDYTQTGSVGYKGSYTIRRSVLQGSAGSVCILRDNGTRSGDCN